MTARTRARRLGLGRIEIACGLIFFLAASAAQAELDVCNKGAREKVQIAFAYREDFPFDPPWTLTAWQGIAPGACATIVTGNIDGYQFLIHAEAKGVTLTSAFASDNVFASNEKFCLVNAAVSKNSVKSVADASSCEEGEKLRTFAIRHAGMFADSTVNLYPDDVSPGKAANSDPRQEDLSAYFGAVYSATDGYISASGNATTRKKALAWGLEGCQKKSSRPDTCELRYEYADRCIAMVDGDREKDILGVGTRDGTEAAAKEWALKRCSARGNGVCKVTFSICSTHAASVANEEKRQLEALESVFDAAGKLFAPKR